MKHGLSKLQRDILLLAYQNRKRDGVTGVRTRGADLCYPEIFHKHWGWEPKKHSWWKPERGDRPATYKRHFSKSEIGERPYRAAQSSLSRAVRRLEERGLVSAGRIFSTGTLNLTERGVEVAENIVNDNA